MKKIGPIIMFVLLLFIASGCEGANPKITEEQAKSIVLNITPITLERLK